VDSVPLPLLASVGRFNPLRGVPNAMSGTSKCRADYFPFNERRDYPPSSSAVGTPPLFFCNETIIGHVRYPMPFWSSVKLSAVMRPANVSLKLAFYVNAPQAKLLPIQRKWRAISPSITTTRK
jgi:hypothetical protein